MAEYDATAYVIDFGNRKNLARISSAKPNLPITVRVVPEGNLAGDSP